MKCLIIVISLISLSQADTLRGVEDGKVNEEQGEGEKEKLKDGVREGKKTSDWSQVYKSEEEYPSPQPHAYPLTKEMRSADWFSSYPYHRYQQAEERQDGFLETVRDGFSGIGDGVRNGFSGLGEGVRNGFSGLGEGVRGSFPGLENGVRGGFAGIGEGVQGGFSGIGDGVRGGFSGIGAGVRDGFSGLGEGLMRLVRAEPNRRPNSVRPNRINRDGPQGPLDGLRGQNPRSPLNGPLGDNRDDFQTQFGAEDELRGPHRNLFTQEKFKRKADPNPLTELVNFPQHVMGGFTKLTGIQLLPASAKVSNVLGWPADRRIEHVSSPAHAPAHYSDSEPAPSEIYQDYLTAPKHVHNNHKEIHLAEDSEASGSTASLSYSEAPSDSDAPSISAVPNSPAALRKSAFTTPAVPGSSAAIDLSGSPVSSSSPSSPVVPTSSLDFNSAASPSSSIFLAAPNTPASTASSTDSKASSPLSTEPAPSSSITDVFNPPRSFAGPSYPPPKQNPQNYRFHPERSYPSPSPPRSPRSQLRRPSRGSPGFPGSPGPLGTPGGRPRNDDYKTRNPSQSWKNSLVRQDSPARFNSLLSLFHLPALYPSSENPGSQYLRRHFAPPPKPKAARIASSIKLKPSAILDRSAPGLAKPVHSEPKPASSKPNPATSGPKPTLSGPKPTTSGPKPTPSEPKPSINVDKVDRLKSHILYYLPSPDLSQLAPVDIQTNYIETDHIKSKYSVYTPTKTVEPLKVNYVAESPKKTAEPIKPKYIVKKKTEEPIKSKYYVNALELKSTEPIKSENFVDDSKYFVDIPKEADNPIGSGFSVEIPEKTSKPFQSGNFVKLSGNSEEVKFDSWRFGAPIKPKRFKPLLNKPAEPIKSDFIDAISGTFVYNEPEAESSFDVLQARIDEKLQDIIDDIADEVDLDGDASEISIQLDIAGEPEDYKVDLVEIDQNDEPENFEQEAIFRSEFNNMKIPEFPETTPEADVESTTQYLIEIEDVEENENAEDNETEEDKQTPEEYDITEERDENEVNTDESKEDLNIIDDTNDSTENNNNDEENLLGSEFSFVIDYTEPEIQQLKVDTEVVNVVLP